jgi:hypothetical protein
VDKLSADSFQVVGTVVLEALRRLERSRITNLTKCTRW